MGIVDDRQRRILDLLNQQGSIQVNDLVADLQVSEMTIRRDLDALEQKGLLRRVHGGAISSQGRSFEPPFLSRASQAKEEKERIGKAISEMVQNGDSLILDIGTTTLQAAQHLVHKKNLTIITPSLPILNILGGIDWIRLIPTGGILRPGELSMVGHLAERAFEEFYVDKLFLAAGCIDLKNGLTEYNLEDALVKRAMLKNAKEVILAADSSKFNRTAMASIGPISCVQQIITDSGLDTETVSSLKELGIKLTLV